MKRLTYKQLIALIAIMMNLNALAGCESKTATALVNNQIVTEVVLDTLALGDDTEENEDNTQARSESTQDDAEENPEFVENLEDVENPEYNIEDTEVLIMFDETLSANKGDLITVTNSQLNIELTNVEIQLANDVFLRIEGAAKEKVNPLEEGIYGSQCILTATEQVLTDKIIVDAVSSLDLNLTDGSCFIGMINNEEEGGTVSIHLDMSSHWTLTGDSYVNDITGVMKNIDRNGYTLYVDGMPLV